MRTLAVSPRRPGQNQAMKAKTVTAIPNPFRVDTANVPLIRAQLASFTKQVPLLYFIVCVNAVALASGFSHVAPAWLGIGVPAVLISICVLRIAVWTRARHK